MSTLPREVDISEWKKRYEHMWDLHQAALARIEEMESRDSRFMYAHRVQTLESKVAELTASLDRKTKKCEKLAQELKRREEDDYLMREAVKSYDALKVLNARLVGDLKHLTVLKNQQDMVLLTQHEVIKDMQRMTAEK